MNGMIDWTGIAFTTPGTRPKIADIVAASAIHFGVTEALIKGECRARQIARARQVAYFLARELTNASLPAIAREIGDKDHTTVLWGVRKITGMIKDNREDMAASVKAVRDLVLSGNPRAEIRRRRHAALEAVAEKEAEEAIAHAERMKQFRRIRDMANAGFIATDNEGRIRQ